MTDGDLFIKYNYSMGRKSHAELQERFLKIVKDEFKGRLQFLGMNARKNGNRYLLDGKEMDHGFARKAVDDYVSNFIVWEVGPVHGKTSAQIVMEHELWPMVRRIGNWNTSYKMMKLIREYIESDR